MILGRSACEMRKMTSGNKHSMMGYLRDLRKCGCMWIFEDFPTIDAIATMPIFFTVFVLVKTEMSVLRQRWGFAVQVILNINAIKQITVVEDQF